MTAPEAFPTEVPTRLALQQAPELAVLAGLAAQARIAIAVLRARATSNQLDAVQIDQARAVVERVQATLIAMESYRRATLPRTTP